MAKRFTDTDIWLRPWYRALTPAEREAWRYILDTCDAVGVWFYDPDGVRFMVGDIDLDSLPSKVNGNLEVLEERKKWWVVDFCSFQYPPLTLSTTSKPLLSYITMLKKHGLWERVSKGYRKGIDSVQEKEKEKDIEKEKEKDGVPSSGTLKLLRDAYPNLPIPESCEG